LVLSREQQSSFFTKANYLSLGYLYPAALFGDLSYKIVEKV